MIELLLNHGDFPSASLPFHTISEIHNKVFFISWKVIVLNEEISVIFRSMLHH